VSVKVVIYVEDSSRVGFWPSHIDSVRGVCQAYGADELDYIDNYIDGFFQELNDPPLPQHRFGDFPAWVAANGVGTIIGLETSATITANGKTPLNLLTYTHPADATYIIGASNGHHNDAWVEVNDWVFLPQAESVGLEGREVLTLTLGHRYFQSLG